MTEARVWTARANVKATALVTVVSAVALVAGYLNKARCTGAPFSPDGRSLIFDRIKDTSVCYSDIQFLWLGRGIDEHIFPYLTGGITDSGMLVRGTVEYPVLTGLLMWIGAIGADTDAQFLFWTAIILAPFGLAIAAMLARMVGWSALVWAAGPALVLYAFHNWELPVVATSVGAIYVTTMTPWTLRTRSLTAAALLAIGFCLKIYPGAFVLPLALYVLTSVRGRYDWRGALSVLGVSAGTVVAINLPFAVLGYNGWIASFTFQQSRQADITTNSIWYWGLRQFYVDTEATRGLQALQEISFQDTVAILSPALVLLSFAGSLWIGWRRAKVTGAYPWVAISASMLCGFLLFHKVHSPQYTLWLVPFFVLLRVPWSLVAGYLVADLFMGIGVFRYFAALGTGADSNTELHAVLIGVWGRAILLVVFMVVFARASLRTFRAPVRAPAEGVPI